MIWGGSPERHPLHVALQSFPQIKHPLPEIPIPIPHFSSPKSHPRFPISLLQRATLAGSTSAARGAFQVPSPERHPQGSLTCHAVAISVEREPLATAAHGPEKGSLSHCLVCRSWRSTGCYPDPPRSPAGGSNAATNHSISENRPWRLIQL